MSGLITFYSQPLESARAFTATVNAPVDPLDGAILQVGLSQDEVAESPKTRIRIVGDNDQVVMSREDGQELRALHVKSQADILKQGLTEIVFDRLGMKNTEKGYMPEWSTNAAVDRPLAASLALAIGRACASKRQ